jgi:CYTH domain-containing protein
MTVQRRFLLASSLSRLIQRERGGLRQIEGFFPEQPQRSPSVRLEESQAWLILSPAGPNDAEEQTEIPVSHAQALLDVCTGEIDYVRTALPLGDHTLLIDHVNHPTPVDLVSVEFDTQEQARGFRPLEWFGPEVTGNARFLTRGIANRSLDEAPETPLSNAALNALLDALENRSSHRPRVHLRKAARSDGQTAAPAQNRVDEDLVREMERNLRNRRPS